MQDVAIAQDDGNSLGHADHKAHECHASKTFCKGVCDVLGTHAGDDALNQRNEHHNNCHHGKNLRRIAYDTIDSDENELAHKENQVDDGADIHMSFFQLFFTDGGIRAPAFAVHRRLGGVLADLLHIGQNHD